MKRALFLLAVLWASSAQALDYDLGGGTDRTPRIIGQVLYSDVGVTTTTPGGLGNKVTFSTITIPVVLTRNGDAIEIYCTGQEAGINEARGLQISINDVDVASRTLVNGSAGLPQFVNVGVSLTRTSSNNQVLTHIAGTGHGMSAGAAPNPIINTFLWTFTDTASMKINCRGESVTQGSTSFFESYVRLRPAP